MIRRLTPAGWQTFRDLRLEALRLEPAAYASSLADWTGLPESEWRARLEANAVFCAFDGHMPAGLAGLRPDGAVIMVYVRAACRGRGMAQGLMEAVRSEAQERGLPQVWLHVHKDNAAALRLYGALGYAITNEDGPDIVMARYP
ncbi:GNAT family N-acetyltransferase [Falsirhodobacter deserti]|uniref:GNAT family N-acetyltransferase n=1 Tax=Falsirhodobacter deserti TaxID=1365611 RepID=UPI000FE35708|nr:GNAT family N-acetyltransferase [Falsirhodobacter deserti]